MAIRATARQIAALADSPNWKQPPATEKEFMAQVIALAKLRGFKVYHTHDSRRSESGWPDLVLVRDRIFFVELKTEKGKVSAEQDDWLRAISIAGGIVCVWRPSMWAEIERVLS